MRNSWVLGLISICAVALFGGCSSDKSSGNPGNAQGAEGQHCYPNGTCNAGLSCLSDLCVNAGTGGSAGTGSDASAGSGGTSGSGGASGSGGISGSGGVSGASGSAGADAGDGGMVVYPICNSGLSTPDQTCAACLTQQCCVEFDACTKNGADVATCFNDCSAVPVGTTCQAASQCRDTNCSTQC